MAAPLNSRCRRTDDTQNVAAKPRVSAWTDAYRYGGLRWLNAKADRIEEIRRDVVWFAPGEKHWHGAAPETAMTHVAIQEKLDRKVIE